jgi:hypothetical protein
MDGHGRAQQRAGRGTPEGVYPYLHDGAHALLIGVAHGRRRPADQARASPALGRRPAPSRTGGRRRRGELIASLGETLAGYCGSARGGLAATTVRGWMRAPARTTSATCACASTRAMTGGLSRARWAPAGMRGRRRAPAQTGAGRAVRAGGPGCPRPRRGVRRRRSRAGARPARPRTPWPCAPPGWSQERSDDGPEDRRRLVAGRALERRDQAAGRRRPAAARRSQRRPSQGTRGRSSRCHGGLRAPRSRRYGQAS